VSDAPRYRDYPIDPGYAAPDFEPVESVVVMKTDDGWEAVWGAGTLLGEFQGSREDAIAWALQRSTNCWVYSEELRDVVRYKP
jgi:hypothetical protein